MLSYVSPAILIDDLHLVDKTMLPRLTHGRSLPPLAQSAQHNPFFEHWSCRPSDYATIPDRSVDFDWRHDCRFRMDRFVCRRIVSYFDIGIQKDASGERQGVVCVDEATLGGFEMRSRKRVWYTSEPEGIIRKKKGFHGHSNHAIPTGSDLYWAELFHCMP